ncbi:MAG: dockerin type I repeat-containing protein, partial [Betaproteobacteria bacterium]|nr:dockerin type I repeat-containing protein [Betaproteobacteria bacterium]
TATCLVNATFTINSYALTAAIAGTGSGTISGTGIACPGDCTENFTHGTMLTLTAVANVGSTFAGWSGGGCTGTGTCTVTLTAANTVTASFTLNTYALAVTKAGTGTGTVTSSPAGINCGATCTANYNHGTMVTLTATADGSSTFAGWSGACTGTMACTVAMDAAKSVTAAFALKSYALSVNKVGAGTVTSSPSGIACGGTCAANYTHGTMVTLTATPDVSTSFTGWSGACSGTMTCTVTMDAVKNVTATFTTKTYTVSPAAGPNGSISPNAPQTIAHGSTASFTVTPDAGYSATVGGTCGGSLSGNTITTNAITADCTVDATFAINTGFVDVVSRKLHGATTRDLPVTGTNTVESRQAQSGGHVLVFRFNAPVTNPGAANIVTQPVSGATATVAIGATNTEVIVALSGVPEIARATVTLSNVNGVAGGIARIGYLPGDVNGSGVVTAADIAYIKAQSGTPNANNYKADINASGGFNSVDISAAKAKAGMMLP